MPHLVIVESSAKARTINRYLGKDFEVRACMGHVADLPKSKMGVDIEHDFAPTYRIIPGRKKVLDEIRKLAKGAGQVFLATDLDREGEAIAWHLARLLKLPTKKIRRVIFNEITRSAIRRAFANPIEIDENKVNAQQARRILDRIVGYCISPLLWRKVRRGLSAGRVQSVAVRLIVEREREIEKFTPEEYWEIHTDLSPLTHRSGEPKKFRAKLTKLEGEAPKLSDQTSAETLVKNIQSADFVVSKAEGRERLLNPPPPFNTSSVQQQASIQLRFRTRKTMQVAQQLYEGVELGPEGAVGLITYMRTDSFQVAGQAVAECRKYINENFSADHLPETARAYRSPRAAQGAHEAIRPTDVTRAPESVKPHLDRDLFRLYELIWKRFVASQMSPGRLGVTDVEVTASPIAPVKAREETEHVPPAPGTATFAVQGRQLLFDGHLRLTGFDRKTELRLPHLASGERLKLLDIEPSQHFTKPPPRFTEASLVRILEKLGIGRPSTYAPIISTIQRRLYVGLRKRQFHATDLGKLVNDELVRHFSDIINVKFTSEMEERLDAVEEAKADWLQLLKEFYKPFSADLKEAEQNMKRPEPEETEYTCEQCKSPMLKRWSARGYFLGCSAYPKCRFTQPLDEEGKPAPRPEPEPTEEKCEKCDGQMLVRTGRHGRFLGCSNFPKCKNTRSLEPPPEIPEELKTCEKCGEPMAVRRSRRGIFLGCTGYPKCRNAKPLPKKK